MTNAAERLAELARSSPWFGHALECARRSDLDDWCIGAGAVRNLVRDALHAKAEPSRLADIDVAHFDAADTSLARDGSLMQRLRDLEPRFPWEVTNQAGVHHWFEDRFGYPVAPLQSLPEAVSTWPEFATSVGVTLDRDGSVRVLAPHGLHDLFGMGVRQNRRVSASRPIEPASQRRVTASDGRG